MTISFHRAVATALLALGLAGTAMAQDFHDRRTVQFPEQVTADNPQRTPALPRKQGFDGTLVLKGGRIFDSVKEAAYPGALVIRQNKIVAVLPPSSTDWPADATIMDVTGKTVMPGLIDMHVHAFSPNNATPMSVDLKSQEGFAVLQGLANLRYSIENGITSVRDMSGVLSASFVLSEWLEQGMAPAPRVFTAGHIVTAWGGHAAERSSIYGPIYIKEVDGADNWRKAVREMFKMGASHIKIASHFAPDEVKAAVEEAHRLGLKVTCDCETMYTTMAVQAGVDSIEHPLPRTDEAIKLMAQKGTAWIPTMQVYQSLFDTRVVYAGSSSRRFSMDSQHNYDILKKMVAAGVTLGVGTDTISEAFAQSPNVYIADLKFLEKAGYTPARALIAATRINSRLLDMGDKLGTLEPGKLADVIVVAGNPDQNLDALRKVETVIRNGSIVVKDGRLFVPRHAPVALAKPSPPETLK